MQWKALYYQQALSIEWGNMGPYCNKLKLIEAGHMFKGLSFVGVPGLIHHTIL